MSFVMSRFAILGLPNRSAYAFRDEAGNHPNATATDAADVGRRGRSATGRASPTSACFE